MPFESVIMKNKTIIVSSVFVMAFLVIVGAGVAANIMTTKPIAPTTTPDLSTFMAREQAYQELINEANQQIELANQQIITLMNTSPEPVATLDEPYLFTADQASVLAANVAETQPIQLPELVSYEGIPAYEVEFENGIVYIDANSGKVLYNGLKTEPVFISSEQAKALALNYLGSGTITQVTIGTFNSQQVYIVQFSNGQSVYVNLYGKVVAVQAAVAASQNDDREDEDEHEDDD